LWVTQPFLECYNGSGKKGQGGGGGLGLRKSSLQVEEISSLMDGLDFYFGTSTPRDALGRKMVFASPGEDWTHAFHCGSSCPEWKIQGD